MNINCSHSIDGATSAWSCFFYKSPGKEIVIFIKLEFSSFVTLPDKKKHIFVRWQLSNKLSELFYFVAFFFFRRAQLQAC